MTQSFAHLCRLCLEPFSGYCQVRQCPMLGATQSGAVLSSHPGVGGPDATRAVSPLAANPDATRAVGVAAAPARVSDPDATRLPALHELPLPGQPGGVVANPATRPLAALAPTANADDDGLSTRYVSPPTRVGPAGNKEP